MKTKTFDCVEMKRRGARIVRKKLAGMTQEQQLAFWREQGNELRKRQQAARMKQKRAGGMAKP